MTKKGSRVGIVLLIFVAAAIVGTTAWMMYKSRQERAVDPSKPFDSSALMIVTSSGGLCDGPCHVQRYNIYGNGTFQGHKKLSSSELSELKSTIASTDFLKYGANPYPQCESFRDGSDEVLLFPQKYGDRTFTPCMLDIPSNDPAFSFINKLLETH